MSPSMLSFPPRLSFLTGIRLLFKPSIVLYLSPTFGFVLILKCFRPATLHSANLDNDFPKLFNNQELKNKKCVLLSQSELETCQATQLSSFDSNRAIKAIYTFMPELRFSHSHRARNSWACCGCNANPLSVLFPASVQRKSIQDEFD